MLLVNMKIKHPQYYQYLHCIYKKPCILLFGLELPLNFKTIHITALILKEYENIVYFKKN